jgi:hypothetical protein
MAIRSSSERALLAVAALAGLFGCSCATARTGHFYSLSDGRTAGAIHIESFQPARGPLTVTLPSGPQCEGEFATVPVRVRRYDESTDRTFQQTEDVTQAGIAFLTCNDGRHLSCRLFKRIEAPDASGHGACKDERGGSYSFVL